ncbi:hypothetical protein [Chitinimonas koreensis]|uniref:hypothetical protein n=1 Tax=Chitinimonas koreensis TaxID=356302 RepID=UPI001654A30A|nr:hypothetical protein [Chitinimonas koreensis]QNM96893.1 hypothetical protein H9L41_00630 [Chitinimonas koreensis]
MKNHPVRIRIVDDEPERSKGWVKAIKALKIPSMDIVALEKDKSRELMKLVADRQHGIRNSQVIPTSDDSPLQDIDVLVVDYDLQELLTEGQWSTGLQVLALARAFSGVKLIVLVNQFGSNIFDLTLTKSVRSPADLDVGSDQLVNPAFWDRSLAESFALGLGETVCLVQWTAWFNR